MKYSRPIDERKAAFISVINSKRRESLIKNEDALTRILKKREGIYEDGSECSFRNLYAGTSNILNSEGAAFDDNFRYEEERLQQSNLPRKVATLICRKIGSKWQDLARNLGLKEGKIDEIERKYQKTYDQMNECLQIFEAIPKHDHLKELCKALLDTRREDLYKEVLSS